MQQVLGSANKTPDHSGEWVRGARVWGDGENMRRAGAGGQHDNAAEIRCSQVPLETRIVMVAA